MGNEPFTIRDYEDEDHNFIMATWLNSLYYNKENKTTLSKNRYLSALAKTIEKILKKATVKIAALKDDPDIILGYAVLEQGKVSWAYVKKDWRNKGIFKRLKEHE